MSDRIALHPKLRLIDSQPVVYEGAKYLMLRDPLSLSEQNLLIPQPMIPALTMLDGTRSPAAIRAALALRYGLFITVDRIEELARLLDDALLLDNERSRQARAEAQARFRQAAFRAPASAGISYPENPDQLSAYLQGYFDELRLSQVGRPVNGKVGGAKNSGSIAYGAKNGQAAAAGARAGAGAAGAGANAAVRGVVSPHIDYERGGMVYAQVWSQAAQAAREAELAIIFGTDHFSEGYPISLTRQSYATPFGVLPSALEVVDELAAVLGEEAAFAGELHHRREHSIELAAVWLHHVRAGRPIQMVPVLCGGLGAGAGAAPNMEAFLNVLRRVMERRKTLVVAAGDLAHIGPAFGGEPVNPGKLIMLKQADDELIESMCSGDASGFLDAIQRVEDENNVCGVSPIYLTLRLLKAPLHGQNHGYLVCAADEHNTSVVTICGITLQ